MVPQKSTDVLRSPKIVRAEEVLRSSDDVPPIVREAHQALRSEIVSLRMSRKIANAKPAKPSQKGPHVGVVGLGVGGATEPVQWVLALATEHDPWGRELLELGFVDAAITAIIASVGAWLVQGQKTR